MKEEKEYLMLAQFIEVMDIISNCSSIEEVKENIVKRKKEYLKIIQNQGEEADILNLSFDEEYINKKLQKGKEIYPKNKAINEAHLAYKIGLIDGMKVKSE